MVFGLGFLGLSGGRRWIFLGTAVFWGGSLELFCVGVGDCLRLAKVG